MAIESRKRIEEMRAALNKPSAISDPEKPGIEPLGARPVRRLSSAFFFAIIILVVFLFPPRLGVERWPDEDRKVRVGHSFILSDPSPKEIKGKIGVLKAETEPAYMYRTEIDYRMWWTEMLVIVFLYAIFGRKTKDA